MNRLKEKYVKEVIPSLMEKYNYKTVMLVPKIEKIVVNIGVGDAISNSIQRFPQRGRQSRAEHKGIRELDCEADTPGRYESRA